LPGFDFARSYALYGALLGQIEELTKGRHLIVVPSGVFTQLPFQVLVTAAPDPALSGADAFRRGHIRAPSAVPRGRYVGDPGVPFLRPGR